MPRKEVEKGSPERLDPDALRRRNRPTQEEYPVEDYKVSAGAVDRVLDHVINPSRDAIRGVTVIDRLQGRLFPLLDIVNTGRAYCLEIAEYRTGKGEYRRKYRRERPVIPNLVDEYLFRSAQWLKSVGGKSYDKAMDIVMAEVETQADRDTGGSDAWDVKE